MMLIQILKAWIKWHKDWDSLCNRCGKCCYARKRLRNGKVIINYNRPCPHLDTKTHLCKIYDDRFRKFDRCGKVSLWTALFNPLLPNDCAYVRTFRLWRRHKKELTSDAGNLPYPM